ncbi:hypothetical protein BJX63DRAFT_333296 [Aspergillus granulosus]|uniref:BZIP domain-containing protein n=1 Tax=Aspergillus granulosus TaxID=176169 RepID=A0ABR4HWT6_9EURO
MSTETSFYPAAPQENSVVAPSSLLLSNGFNQEFLNLALFEKPTHPEISMAYLSNSQPVPTQDTPPRMKDETPRSRLRNRALRPAPRENRKRSLDDEANQALPSLQPQSYTDFSFAAPDRDYSPDQDFTFDDAHNHHHSNLSSPKFPPLTHAFRHDEVQKRERHLERNRAAASKSRQKKKRETDQLKTRFHEASRQKRCLEEEIKGLHSDLLFLKDQILMHSRCDDEAIHVYLGHMVKQATKHGSISSVSTEDDIVPSASSPETEMQPFPEQTVPDMFSPGPGPGMSCNVEKPLIDPMIYHPAGNIFDYQISIS